MSESLSQGKISTESSAVFEQHLLSAAIIKLCRSAVGMVSDPLSGFKGAVILQKIRDAGFFAQISRMERFELSNSLNPYKLHLVQIDLIKRDPHKTTIWEN
jgi:hypothetical protein